MKVLIVGSAAPSEEFIRRKVEGLRQAGVEVRLARSVAGALTKADWPDVIHFEWNSAAIDALSDPAVWSIPTIISCRGTQIRIRPHVTVGYADKLAETFRRASAAHCVCEAIRGEAIALGLDPRKAEVIYPAVDINEFTVMPPPPHDGPARLLSVGTLIWTKGYEYALLALRALVDRGVDASLEIIGDGNERQRVLFTINDLGLTDRVTLRFTIPPSQVREAMQHSDIFLHSSLSEGVSNAVLEAMACGLPVVTADAGGMHEAVRDGHDGFLVPLRDPAAAAAAVERLARDPELRVRIGRAGRATVESRFRLDDQVARFITMYERVAPAQVSA